MTVRVLLPLRRLFRIMRGLTTRHVRRLARPARRNNLYVSPGLRIAVAQLPVMLTRPVLIAPSLLSADFGRLGEEVCAVDAAGADWIHLAMADGRFVPTISFGPVVIEAVRDRRPGPSVFGSRDHAGAIARLRHHLHPQELRCNSA